MGDLYIINVPPSRASDHKALDTTLREILRSIKALAAHLASFERKVMTSNAQLTQDLTDIKNEAAKAKTEIVGRIAALEAALADDNISAESEAALTALKAEVKGLDDLNVDTPPVDPPVEPPVPVDPLPVDPVDPAPTSARRHK
jgi:hypothetical protein